MSITVMNRVWDYYAGPGGSDLLALLALADWSDDNGRCWPSIAAIASKTRLSRSQAQRVVHSLIANGYLQVVGNAGGGKPGSTRRYQINLDALTGHADATPTGRTSATGSAYATGRTDAAEGSHGCTKTGRTGATQTVIDTSIDTSLKAATRTRAESPPHASEPFAIPDQTSNRAVQIAVLLRRNGADPRTLPNDRHIAAWARDGITDGAVLQALETAKQRRKDQGSNQPIGTAYLASIIADPPPNAAARVPTDNWRRSNAGIDRMAQELGMRARAGESYADFADRLDAELRQRQAQGGMA